MPPANKKRISRWLVVFAVAALAYGVVAYALLPLLWRHYEHQQGLASKPMITETAEGIPGDPLNVGLVGDEVEVHRIMLAAGWQPADAITLRSSIAIAGSVVLDRPYEAAPVSTLFYEGRRQDFAFEKAIGGSADRRHHVRLWLVLAKGDEGRSVWLGAATRDLGVGLSHYTGQITHHIAADIDAERDALLGDLAASRMVTALYKVSGVGPTLFGRNGEGDVYFTDGELRFAVISLDATLVSTNPAELESPALSELKDNVWSAARSLGPTGEP
ncbi:MAG: LssY C-terminal domain-containing protein [Aestuariivirga sp.]